MIIFRNEEEEEEEEGEGQVQTVRSKMHSASRKKLEQEPNHNRTVHVYGLVVQEQFWCGRFNVGSMSKPGLAGGGLYRIQSSVLCFYSHNNTRHPFCLWIGDAGLESSSPVMVYETWTHLTGKWSSTQGYST